MIGTPMKCERDYVTGAGGRLPDFRRRAQSRFTAMPHAAIPFTGLMVKSSGWLSNGRPNFPVI
jgi:hypothetical protein